MGERGLSDKENNDGGPMEINISRSELNDSFDASFQRKSFTKIRSKRSNNNNRNITTISHSHSPAFRVNKECPLIRAPNSHVRFDAEGEPILNLRPSGNIQNAGIEDSKDGFTIVQNKSKRKKRLQTNPTPNSGFLCSSPSPTPSDGDLDIESNKRNPEQTDSNYSPRIKKYWIQRYRLFSRYDEGILLDEEAWYSVTPEKIAEHIAQVMSCGLIVDAFCGVGGNAIQFAKTCDRVIAIDIDSSKIEKARNNARIYGVLDKIEFIVGDFFKVAPRLVADAMFLSPPWGGPEYLNTRFYNLQKMGGSMDGYKVFSIAKSVTPNLAFFVPKNTNLEQLKNLSADAGGRVNVEKNMLNNKTKALTAYYGDFTQK